MQNSNSWTSTANEVSFLDTASSARWDNFVHAAQNATFFHLSGWKSIIEEQLGHRAYYLYCESDGQIEGILPLVHVKSLLFGNALISLPFLVYGGPVANTEQALQCVLDAASRLAYELQVDHLELRNRVPVNGEWIGKNQYATFRKKILPEPEANLLAIPRKQRAVVRKAMKAGLHAVVDTDTKRLYGAMLACKRNLGTPFFRRAWLNAILQEFGDQVEITTIMHRKEVVSSVMSFRFRNEILPYYGGGGSRARLLGGNDFMYWSVMETACKDGVELFDYGRSMVGSGAYRFKKHWGFEPTPLPYQCALISADTVPELNPSNPRYRFLIDAWKRLPLPVVRLLGPPLASRLG